MGKVAKGIKVDDPLFKLELEKSNGIKRLMQLLLKAQEIKSKLGLRHSSLSLKTGCRGLGPQRAREVYSQDHIWWLYIYKQSFPKVEYYFHICSHLQRTIISFSTQRTIILNSSARTTKFIMQFSSFIIAVACATGYVHLFSIVIYLCPFLYPSFTHYFFPCTTHSNHSTLP